MSAALRRYPAMARGVARTRVQIDCSPPAGSPVDGSAAGNHGNPLPASFLCTGTALPQNLHLAASDQALAASDVRRGRPANRPPRCRCCRHP
jgi:hypothetical protein